MSEQEKGAACCRPIDHLIEGVRQFKDRFYRQAPELMRTLVDKGQAPAVLLISCSDSRVDPTLLSGAGPGELFVVRNVANLVPPYSADDSRNSIGAASEYAVNHLHVDHVVVLGHAHCGGIKAMLEIADGKEPAGEMIGTWVATALDAAKHYVHEDGSDRAVPVARLKQVPFLVERAAIRESLKNLATYPWVAKKLAAGTLKLHGWWFDLDTGDLWATSDESDVLLPVT
jgi:carbonic anhydrase